MRSQALGLAITLSAALAFASSASAAGTVAWAVHAVAEPTAFSPANASACEIRSVCDRYQLLVANVGKETARGAVTLTDTLPAGITTLGTPESKTSSDGTEWFCTTGAGSATVSCSFVDPEGVRAGAYMPNLQVKVSAPGEAMAGTLRNEISVSGGGAARAGTAIVETAIDAQPPQFEASGFAFEALAPDGGVLSQAGAHPWSVTATLTTPEVDAPPGSLSRFVAVENPKEVAVELPIGLVGDPQALAQCTENELRNAKCPPASAVGTVALLAGLASEGEFVSTGKALVSTATECCSAVYNMAPEGGYPAEFGFTYLTVPVYLYASVVHRADGYRIRIVNNGIPVILEVSGVVVTFFGDPSEVFGGSSTNAFLTNPADCSGGPLASRLAIASWEDPTKLLSTEATVYPRHLSGCRLLRFEPSLGLAPSPAAEGGTTQADAPSAYAADLKLPQASSFSELATPDLKDATVTLPVGVSVSPSAAQGLVGCPAEGPEAINIGSQDIGPEGRDLGDPEATELGAGHAGGNGSPYDDGQYHTAKGHCPAESTLGTAEVFTPLLPTRCGGEGEPACKAAESPAPLQGHVYLSQPKCGGAGQPACTEASATNGELFGLYIEAEGAGVIVKLAGTVGANPSTGQLTATFNENPQLPFSELKLHFHGGPRAPLANPQGCGAFATTSTLTSWGGQEASGPSPAFGIDWDGRGGACPSGLPFAPGFSAGTVTPLGGAFSPFTLTFSRQDREQDLSGLTVTMPPGLLGALKGVERCPEPQASRGECGAGSLIGHDQVAAGSGSQPLWETGQVFLTGPYKGAPFGLSILTPAVAGPFNLGNVVVRAAIAINPVTSQITTTSDSLPQQVDGVPLRLKTVNVAIDRPGFIFNPTNCDEQALTGTISSAQGATAGVSSPFAVTGCTNLPFKPSFTASTQAKTSKQNGASLVVKVAQKAGEANIHKVDLQLPITFPSRLTTLQKACTEAQFNANPAGCPEGSFIGTATAVTPVLNVPLAGPAILVSHGGAAFPDVEFILQGEGVEIVLDGKTDIKKGITYSKFDTVPDAPLSSFETVLPEGPHSVLAGFVPENANGSFCGLNLAMPTTIEAQNGAQIKQTTKVAVDGCKPAIEVVKKTRSRGKVLLTLRSTVAGTLAVTGSGVKKTKQAVAVGEQQIQVALTNAGRRRKTINLKIVLKSGRTTLSGAVKL
ncbi:MAG: hypothetical protein ACHQQS_17070 [Thermoanaerobaculales bacterium]